MVNARGINFKFRNKEDTTITVSMIVEVLVSTVRKQKVLRIGRKKTELSLLLGDIVQSKTSKNYRKFIKIKSIFAS